MHAQLRVHGKGWILASLMNETAVDHFMVQSVAARRPVTLHRVPVDRATLLAILNERSSTASSRAQRTAIGIRKRGEVYTPPRLVDWILDLAGYSPSFDIGDSYFVDPACGLGSFLREAVSRLKTAYVNKGLDCSRLRDASLVMRGIESHVMGIEVSSTAIQRSVLSYLEPLRDVIKTMKQHDQSYVPQPAIFQHDALSPDLINNAPFDFVIGNPPYVRHRDLPKEIIDRQSKIYQTATGRFDEYVLFFELALKWLKVGGRVAFITSDRFLSANYGGGLRSLLSTKAKIEWLFRLPDRIFEGVGIYPVVTIAQRSDRVSRNTLGYLELNSIEELQSVARKGHPFEDPRVVKVVQDSLDEAPWSFVPNWASAFVGRARHSCPPLESVARGMFTGVATGANSVFVLRGKTTDLEPDRLVPAVRAPDIKKGRIAWGGHYLLNPYNTVEGVPRAIDLDQYPLMKRYLERHKGLLKLK